MPPGADLAVIFSEAFDKAFVATGDYFEAGDGVAC